MHDDFLTTMAGKLAIAKPNEINPDFAAMMQRMRDFSPQIREQRRTLERENRITQRNRVQ